MVRDLAVPAWVDSVHHATISRLIVEQGAYPSSYEPYVQVSTASYHAGYHALVAFFHWLSGLEIDQAMLLLGQVLNACTVLAVYTLGVSITKNRQVGLFAAFISAFLTPMPNFYTSWGRYTQLTGLLILPISAALLIRLLDGWAFGSSKDASRVQQSNSLNLRFVETKLLNRTKIESGVLLACLAGFTAAGLFMVHYRVAAFMGLLMIAYFTGEIFRSLKLPPPLEFLAACCDLDIRCRVDRFRAHPAVVVRSLGEPAAATLDAAGTTHRQHKDRLGLSETRLW